MNLVCADLKWMPLVWMPNKHWAGQNTLYFQTFWECVCLSLYVKESRGGGDLHLYHNWMSSCPAHIASFPQVLWKSVPLFMCKQTKRQGWQYNLLGEWQKDGPAAPALGVSFLFLFLIHWVTEFMFGVSAGLFACLCVWGGGCATGGVCSCPHRKMSGQKGDRPQTTLKKLKIPGLCRACQSILILSQQSQALSHTLV